MPQCAVATCRNSHRRTRGRRIRYHRFPQIPEVRTRWVRACGRVPLSNGDIPFNIQTARICSLHFTNDSYEKDMEHLVLGLPLRSRLRRGAVPTLGVPVNVQPVTKILVDEARRSVKTSAKLAKLSKQSKSISKRTKELITAPLEEPYVTNHAYAPQGIDVLLAVGLKPASGLNKMHAMEGGEKKIEDSSTDIKRCVADAEEDSAEKSTKLPQNQQNGAALPEEAANAERLLGSVTPKKEKRNSFDSADQLHYYPHTSTLLSKLPKLQGDQTEPNRTVSEQQGSVKYAINDDQQSYRDAKKKRLIESSTQSVLTSNGSSSPKKFCMDREQFINSLIGSEKFTAEELAIKSSQLRAEVRELDELARVKETEWNEILSMRKLKEEAFLRIERRRQMIIFMENNGESVIPPASLSLEQHAQHQLDGKHLLVPKEERLSRTSKTLTNYSHQSPIKQQQILENGPKHISDAQNLDNRQIGEGRQGPIVDVRSIIADYRLRHPEVVPKRRGRRMRNSVNVGLGAGGAMVETIGNMDSRPSSTDSCKSNPNVNDSANPMSFKEVLFQFAKMSQQQGEPIKAPQNYPDVTLHPVAPAPAVTLNSTTSNSGSLLHGILTKSQSPRPTTFSPTLARLLTAPEREKSAPSISPISHHLNAHLLHFQGSNPVSINDFLSSSKARTEITITPVVNSSVQNHTNNIIQIDDAEEDIFEEKDSKLSMGVRENREERDSPPRCQGCHERSAQFVCAGCGNQWYCSRECQVAAWDDHSEVCSG